MLKRDVSTAKNYLDDKEIDTLNRIVVMFLDQAEFRAERRQDINMRDWEGYLDKFLLDTELPVLEGSGSVSHERAQSRAHRQYHLFSEQRRMEAETAAEAHYLEDLSESAKILGAERKKTRAPKPRTTTKRK